MRKKTIRRALFTFYIIGIISILKMSQEESEEYEVEAVIGERVINGQTEFNIHWKGYPPEECTWEREQNVNCAELIDKFRKQDVEILNQINDDGNAMDEPYRMDIEIDAILEERNEDVTTEFNVRFAAGGELWITEDFISAERIQAFRASVNRPSMNTEISDILGKQISTDGQYEFLVRFNNNPTGEPAWLSEELIDETRLEQYHDSPNAITDIDGGESIVKAILDCRIKNRKTEFFVKWRGYSARFNSWLNEIDMNCQDLIDEFFKQNPNKNPKKSLPAIRTASKRKLPTRSTTAQTNPPENGDDDIDDDDIQPLAATKKQKTKHFVLKTVEKQQRKRPNRCRTSIVVEEVSEDNSATTMMVSTPNSTPNPKPKKARQMKDNTFKHYTLVRGLNKMIRPEKFEKLKGAIDTLVPLISKSMILGSRHAHVRLMELVQNAMHDEERTGIRAEDHAEIRAEFTPPAVRNNKGVLQKHGYVVERDFNPTKRTSMQSLIHNDPIHPNFQLYLDVYGVEIPYLPFGVRCHEYAMNQFCTNFHNNIRFHAYNRVRKFFNVHSNNTELKRKTLKYLFYVKPKKKNARQVAIPVPDERLLKLYHEVLRPLLPPNINTVPLGWLGESLRDRYDWYRHVHEFMRLQLWIHANNLQCDEEKDQLPSFTTIPQYNFKRKFLTLDTKALATIANSFERRAEKTPSLDYGSSDIEIRNRIWQRYFKLELLNKEMRYFDYTMTTDGVSAHFVMRNKRKQRTKREILDVEGNVIAPEVVGFIDDRIKREPDDEIRTKYANNEYQTIIGYDPGYKLPVAIVRMDIDTGNETSFTMHWKEFRKLCGDPERQQRRYRIAGKHELKMRKLRENRIIYPEQPSNKSPDYWTYMDYQMRTFNQCCAVYMRRSMARMNFDKYICTQRALQKIAKIITRNERCILAVGDFKFSANSPIRGSVRCPMRALFNLLAQQYGDVIEIDEYLTTQICSICGSRMQKKGGQKDRIFVCKNRKPADLILPRANTWTAKLHKDRIRAQFRRLPEAERYNVQLDNNIIEHRERITLPTERNYQITDNPQRAVIEAGDGDNNVVVVAKHQSIVWNRDLNAPRNMIYKLLCMLNGNAISPVFNRPPPRNNQQADNEQPPLDEVHPQADNEDDEI